MACSPPFLGNFILLQQLGHLFVVNFSCWNGLVISPGEEQRQPFKKKSLVQVVITFFQCFQDLLYCKICHFLMLIKTLPRLLDKESKLEKPISKQCISKETHQAVNVHCTCVITTEPP